MHKPDVRCKADADSLVRCSPGEDATNGFFVSLFVRGNDEDDAAQHETKKRKEPVDGGDSPEQRTAKPKRRKKQTKA